MKNNKKNSLKINFAEVDLYKGLSVNSLTFKINSKLFKTQVVNGEDYLVAPVILIAEAVLNGRYYPAEELENNVQAWNGRPVPVNHPKDSNGNPISANSIDVMRKDVIGQIFDVKYEPKTNKTPARLKGNIYLNVKQTLEKSPELWAEIENNENIEVSTGLYTQDVPEPGIFNNVKYDSIATNYRPDHLAALPGGKGACSWGDGCGIRDNAEHGDGEEEEAGEAKKFKKKKKKKGMKTFAALKKFAKDTFGLEIFEDKDDADEEDKLEDNELSFSQIEQAMRNAIQERRGFEPDSWVWVRQAYDNRFIYSVEARGEETTLFEQEYTVDKDDEIVLIGDPVEVEENITFEPVTNNNKALKGDVMKTEMIKKIIANDKNEYTEDDEKTLLKFNEEQLKALSCDCDGEEEADDGEEVPAEEAPTGNDDDNKDDDNKDEMITMSKDALKALVQDTVDATIKSNTTTNEKAPLVEALKANGIELEKEEVEAFSIKSLQKMVEKSTPKSNKRSAVAIVPSNKMNANENDEEKIEPMPDFIALCQEEHAKAN